MTLDAAVAAVVWGLMFVVGLELTGADFRPMLTQPRAVVAGTLGPLLLLPLLAAGLLESGPWPPPVFAGLILLAAGPAGALANVYAYLAGANEALRRDAAARHQSVDCDEFEARLRLLTDREREVMDLAAQGVSSKVIAQQLGISSRTVEVHRGHLLDKLAVGSITELIYLIGARRA